MSTRTIYIVDDNTEFRESTRFWLSGAGFEVHDWGDPLEAIEKLATRDRNKSACLMLDARMPALSGMEVHDALIRRGAELPIIYMSGHADVPMAVKAMQKGAVTLLEKPFDDDALEAALESAFAGGARRVAHQAPVQERPHLAGGAIERMASGLAQRQGETVASSDQMAGRALGSSGSESASALSQGHANAGLHAVFSPEREQAHQRFADREAKLTPREREVLGYVILGVYNKNIADRIGLSIKTVELYRARGMAKMQARSVAELTRMMVSQQV